MKLTEEDIQKISLYVPFNVKFSDLERQSFWTSYIAKGIIGSVVIGRWDEDDQEILDSDDIANHENNSVPVLRRLDKMVDAEYREFERLAAKQSQLTKYTQLCFHPEVILYALKNHFDIFGLIDQGKAIDMDAKKAAVPGK